MKELELEEYPGLPKWPGVYVTGKSVTPEQAKEIIFRTDRSISYPSEYLGGNDQQFQKYCCEVFGWKPIIDIRNMTTFAIKDDEIRREVQEKFVPECSWHALENWVDEMQIVGTEYVYNNWLSSAYIFGPTGWVSPSGEVLVEGHNYGKWPGVSEIASEWKKLAKAFPYIDLVCTLFDNEAMEDGSKPVCSIIVKDGGAKVFAPDLSLHPRAHSVNPEQTMQDSLSMIEELRYGNYSREHGWPSGWVEEFGAKSTAAMKKVAPWATKELVQELESYLSKLPAGKYEQPRRW